MTHFVPILLSVRQKKINKNILVSFETIDLISNSWHHRAHEKYSKRICSGEMSMSWQCIEFNAYNANRFIQISIFLNRFVSTHTVSEWVWCVLILLVLIFRWCCYAANHDVSRVHSAQHSTCHSKYHDEFFPSCCCCCCC